MELLLEADLLADFVQKLQFVASARSQRGIIHTVDTRNVAFRLNGDRLEIRATDLHRLRWASVGLPSPADERKFMVDGDLLSTVIRGLGEERACLSITDTGLMISQAGNRFSFRLYNGELPSLSPLGEDASRLYRGDVNHLLARLRYVGFAAAGDLSNPVLTGIFLGRDGQLVATNRIAAAWFGPRHVSKGVVVPPLICSELSSMPSEFVELWSSDESLRILGRDVATDIYLLSGTYPLDSILGIIRQFDSPEVGWLKLDGDRLRHLMRIMKGYIDKAQNLNLPRVLHCRAEDGSMRLSMELESIGSIHYSLDVSSPHGELSFMADPLLLHSAIGATRSPAVLLGLSTDGSVLSVREENNRDWTVAIALLRSE